MVSFLRFHGDRRNVSIIANWKVARGLKSGRTSSISGQSFHRSCPLSYLPPPILFVTNNFHFLLLALDNVYFHVPQELEISKQTLHLKNSLNFLIFQEISTILLTFNSSDTIQKMKGPLNK